VKVKKRALHLAVAVGVVGAAVGIAAPQADAVVVIPTNCAGYIQGDISPTGGVLPPDLIPFGIGGNNYGVVAGVIGGDGTKIINDLGNNVAKGVKFSAKLTLDTTPILSAEAAASAQTLTLAKGSLAVAWKNDALGRPSFPTVAVAESGKLNAVTAKAAVMKGVVTAVPGPDSQGVVIGPLDTVTNVQTIKVNKGVTGGNFRIRLSLPGNAGTSYLPIIIDTPNIPYNASGATIKATVEGTFNAALGGPITSATVSPATPSTSTPGPSPGAAPPVIGANDGTYGLKVDFLAGPIAGQHFALGVRTTGQIGTFPNLVQTSSLLSPVDVISADGGMHNSNQVGGSDIGTQVISILQGGAVITGQGIVSNGPVGGTGSVVPGVTGLLNGKNIGKSTTFQDTQLSYFMFPIALVSSLNNALAANLANQFLQTAVLGVPFDADYCSFGGLLLLFCASNADLIPSDFAGFCQGILNPANV
jgi:hypothetical protein